MKKIRAVVGLMGMCLASAAMAKGIGEVFSAAQSQLQGAADLLSGGSYVAGAAFGVQAALKLREHSENPQHTRLGKPLMLAVVSGCLLGLPSLLDTNTGSLGLQKGSMEKGGLR